MLYCNDSQLILHTDEDH